MTILLLFVISKTDFVKKVKIKLGVVELLPEDSPDYWAVFSWNNCLQKLDYDADIVFLGNSITRGSDFQKAFPDKKIVNLGYSGDNCKRMLRRIETVKFLNPEKVFLMIGINDLAYMSLDVFENKYETLIDSIHTFVPDAQLFLESILPVSKEMTERYVDNQTIKKVNEMIESLAEKKGFVYINLYDSYLKDGYLNNEYTTDGVHLRPEAYHIWQKKVSAYIND